MVSAAFDACRWQNIDFATIDPHKVEQMFQVELGMHLKIPAARWQLSGSTGQTDCPSDP
jgi:hypothetical protein